MTKHMYKMPWARITGELPDWRLHRPLEDPVPEHVRKKFNIKHRRENGLWFCEPDPVTQSKFLDIPALLGLADAYVTVNVQKPGNAAPMHKDMNQGHWPDEDWKFKKILKKAFKAGTEKPFGHMSDEEQAEKLERCFVFLEDYVDGHCILMDGDYIKDWRAGDVLWFDWRECEHATANLSMQKRCLLQVMGHRTEKWRDINASSRLTEIKI